MMLRVYLGIFSLALGVFSSHGGVNPEPAAYSLAFSSQSADRSVLSEGDAPPWIRGYWQQGGVFTDHPGAWVVPETLPNGQGRLGLQLDRDALAEDLAMTLLYDDSEDADFAIQLLDEQGRVVVLDLFANIIEACEAAQTDTFVIPLEAYPEASQIVLHRISGPIAIYGVVLYPVVTEVPATLAHDQQLADLFGDMLHPAHPLLVEADRLADEKGRPVTCRTDVVKVDEPLSHRNVIGSDVLSAHHYPEFVPSEEILHGEFDIPTSGTTFGFAADVWHRLRLYHPDCERKLDGMSGSSAVCAKMLLSGGVPMAVISRPITSAEKETFFSQFGYPLLEAPVAIDALQILVHPSNPIEGITLPQIDAVFGQELRSGAPRLISCWEELLGEAGRSLGAIQRLGGDSEWGTGVMFSRLALAGGPMTTNMVIADVRQRVARLIEDTPQGLGFAVTRPRSDKVKILPVARNTGEPSYEPVARNIYNRDYPLVRNMYVYVNAPTRESIDPALQEFLRLLFSREGQTVIAQTGTLPLDARQAQRSRAVFGL